MSEFHRPAGLRLVTLPRRRRTSAAAMLLESGQQITLALWIGGIVAVSALAVPAILRGVEDPLKAARFALEMVGQVTILGCGAACYLLLSTLLMHLLSMRSTRAAVLQAVILLVMTSLAVGAQLSLVPPALALLREDTLLFTRGSADPAFAQFRWLFGARLAAEAVQAVLGTFLLLTGTRRWSRSEDSDACRSGPGSEDRTQPFRG